MDIQHNTIKACVKWSIYEVAGMTVVRKYDEQSAVPCTVVKTEAWIASIELVF